MSEPRINDRIRVPEVRLVGPAGEQVGIVRIEDALRLAAESDLDLVEVAPQAKPPVAKLMDFGKYKYEAAVKAREARKNQTNTVLKEIRFRLKIDTHDYETKRGHALRFLGAGDKVKAMIQFRGREQQRPEMGIRLLQKFAEDVSEVGVIESTPRIDGRNMVMVIGPTKNKAEAKAEARRATQRADAKAANEAAKSGGEPPRVQTSGSGNAPMTQSLADLLPEGYSITSEPEAPAKDAPAEGAAAAGSTENTSTETTPEAATSATAPAAPAKDAGTTSNAAPAAPQAAPTRAASAPRTSESRTSAPRASESRTSAPRTSEPRSSAPRAAAPRPAAERPAASRSAAPKSEAPAAGDAVAPSKPAGTGKPTPMPKPGAPKPSATPKPAGRATPPRSPSGGSKPDSTD
ncbi:translation initiation factor IF-3 [uncultured Arthrobacter sp.]|uniref:translation initiation factor IF-3 n=1 Tax=uncultured Arthrobacter sp. TaxID=114050 RepID=UPI00261B2D03|nr:translation initiation factor IF-3 [uncultured Arthrobacter sp.]